MQYWRCWNTVKLRNYIKNMKKWTLVLFLSLVILNIRAEELKYLTVTLRHKEKSLDLASVQKLTFSQGMLLIHTSEGQVQLPMSEMQKLSFTSLPTSLSALDAQSGELRIDKGRIYASGNGLLRVYNSEGRLVALRQVQGSVSLSTESLPHGMYILQLGKQAIKFVR